MKRDSRLADMQPVRYLLVCECNQGVLSHELLIHNPKVAGSSPAPATKISNYFNYLPILTNTAWRFAGERWDRNPNAYQHYDKTGPFPAPQLAMNSILRHLGELDQR